MPFFLWSSVSFLWISQASFALQAAAEAASWLMITLFLAVQAVNTDIVLNKKRQCAHVFFLCSKQMKVLLPSVQHLRDCVSKVSSFGVLSLSSALRKRDWLSGWCIQPRRGPHSWPGCWNHDKQTAYKKWACSDCGKRCLREQNAKRKQRDSSWMHRGKTKFQWSHAAIKEVLNRCKKKKFPPWKLFNTWTYRPIEPVQSPDWDVQHSSRQPGLIVPTLSRGFN